MTSKQKPNTETQQISSNVEFIFRDPFCLYNVLDFSFRENRTNLVMKEFSDFSKLFL